MSMNMAQSCTHPRFLLKKFKYEGILRLDHIEFLDQVSKRLMSSEQVDPQTYIETPCDQASPVED